MAGVDSGMSLVFCWIQGSEGPGRRGCVEIMTVVAVLGEDGRPGGCMVGWR